MSHLADIPIRTACASSCEESRDRLSPGGVAVLAKIERCLEDLRISGSGGGIALRREALLPGDLEKLRDVLGAGEVAVEISALGGSTIQETAIPCVWWLNHRSSEDKLLGHWIEIAEVPALLRGDATSISFGLLALRGRAATFGGANYPFTNEPDAEGGNAT